MIFNFFLIQHLNTNYFIFSFTFKDFVPTLTDNIFLFFNLALTKPLFNFFISLIILGIPLNLYKNRFYDNSWTIGEWLINYQGGFIRRGLLGEGIYNLCNVIKISPIFVIWLISISSYYLLLKLTIFESRNKVSSSFLLSPGIFLAPIIGDFLIRKDLLLLLIFLISLKLMKIKRPNLIFLNVLNITGILIHESFAIYALPIQFIIIYKYNLLKNNYINFLKFSPSLCFFICCLIFFH